MTAQEEAIEARYQELCKEPSDINEHLETLRQYADGCESVCEMGVRSCVSLHAFLASKAKKVVAYDIFDVAVPASEKLTFVCADVLEIEIEPTDLLFLDTLHTKSQLEAELWMHSRNVSKYIICHDVEIFGQHGEDGKPGLNFALSEFLESNPSWKEIYRSAFNNGLAILEHV